VKIGIVVPFSWSFWGAVVEHAELQAAALEARGHEVKLVMGNDPPGQWTRILHPRHGRDGPPPPEVIPVGRSVIVPANSSLPNIVLSPRTARRLRIVLEREQFDVVHIHSLYQFHTWFAARCCRRAGVPYIVRPHGALDPYHLRQHRWRKAMCTWLVEGRALDAAAGMHYTSIAEHEHAVRHHGRLPRGFVVPLGVELGPAGQPDELVRRHPELAGRTLVTFLGRLTPKKRLDLLVDAFAVVAEADERAHLVVAGPDDGVGNGLRARVSGLGLEARVSMLGLLTGAPKSSLLRRSRAVALPSEDESFGVAVAEAMHAGTAVVVTEGVAIHREVAMARAGLVVPPRVEPLAEALLGFVRDEARAEEAGRNGWALARSRWTWRQVAADLERMYAEAITRG